MNQRSSQNMVRTGHLLHILDDVTEDSTMIAALQETWLTSHMARDTITYPMGPTGWHLASLCRSKPGEPPSGGIMTAVRTATTNHMRVRAHTMVLDNLGAIRTDVYREYENAERKTVSDTTAVINVYVPTGANALTSRREKEFASRVFGALKNASENNERVIITGDWNHLTDRWVTYISGMQGFKLVARAGVEVTMVKTQISV